MMKNFIGLLLLIFCFTNAGAEGTKELLDNNPANVGGVIACGDFFGLNTFHYDKPAQEQLRVRITNATETVYMGFNLTDAHDDAADYTTTSRERYDTYVRVRRASDNMIVAGPTLLTTAGPGWISSVTSAIVGPLTFFAGGYGNEIIFTPGQADDYIIEFAVNNNTADNRVRYARYIDVTVHDPAMAAGSAGIVKGRLYAQTWGFTPFTFTDVFNAHVFIYAQDSVVTEIDFNGIQPAGFDVNCNNYGVRGDLSPDQNRLSDYNNDLIAEGVLTPGEPDYLIFLNNPDTLEFPSGSVGELSGIEVKPCTGDDYCINVSVTKSGTANILLTFANMTTRMLQATVSPGVNCVPWDGLDGNGDLVLSGSQITVDVGYLTGLTHLPLRDVEHNANGFIVSLVRPTTSSGGSPLSPPLLYWDDSNIITGTAVDGLTNLTGTSSPAHRWTNRGDNANQEWINTWWYINQERDTVLFDVDSSKWLVTGVLQLPASCEISTTLQLYSRFINTEINIADVDFDFSTNYPAYFTPTDTDTVVVADTTFIYVTYDVDPDLNYLPPPVTLTWNVSASNTSFPACNSDNSQSCAIVVLPVDILNFTGHLEADNGILEWRTDNEDWLDKYVLERAMQIPGRGKTTAYQAIAEVSAMGQQQYNHKDPNLQPGTYYYRLRYIDLDGTVGYASNTVVLSVEYRKPELIYHGDRVWVVNPYSGNTRLSVYDVQGKLVSSCTECKELELPRLGQSVYVARYTQNDIQLDFLRFMME